VFIRYLRHRRLLAVSLAGLFLVAGFAAAKGGGGGGHGGGGGGHGGGHGGGGGYHGGGGGYHGGGGGYHGGGAAFRAGPSFHGVTGPSLSRGSFNGRVMTPRTLNRGFDRGLNRGFDRGLNRGFDRFSRRFDFDRDFDRRFRRFDFFPGFFGFGWGWPGYDNYSYLNDYGYGGYPSYMYSSDYGAVPDESMYYNEPPLDYNEPPLTSPSGDDVLINVEVPNDAEVWFQGQRTSQTGTHREFESPPLAPGREYQYEITVRWRDDGQTVKQTRRIDVRAGDRVDVIFGRPHAR